MKLINILHILLCGSIFLCLARSENGNPTETNEIIPKEAISKLDPSVRLALLKAIDKLEKEAADESAERDEENHVTDEILEESTPPDVTPTVQFYTADVDERKPNAEPLAQYIQKAKGAKEKSARHIAAVTTNEISSQEEITFQITKPKFVVKKKPPTTTTTTTTTTPKPTHNEDGENIEVVSKQDIKIYEAPLVTAFTVQQDEKGTAKRVIPIVTAEVPKSQRLVSAPGPTIQQLKVVQSQSSSNEGALLPTPLPTESSTPTVASNNFQNGPVLANNNFVSTVIPTQNQEVNNFLLERQRQLEQQIYQLQLQARQQQEQIYKQLQLLEEQRNREIRLNTPEPPKNDFVIRPSVEFIAPPSTQTPTQFPYPPEQQLPVKEAVNFRFSTFFNQQQLPKEQQPVQIQQSNQLNFIPSPTFLQTFQQQQPPIQPPLEAATFQHLPQRNYQQFHQQPAPLIHIPFARLPETVHQQNQQNRVRQFRQEANTANFGISSPPTPNTLQQLPNANGGNTLQNILFQSALNHGINPYTAQNFRYPGQ